MVTKVQKWGNSLGLRLPKGVAQEMRLKDGTEVDVRVKGGAIVVKRVRKPRYKLKDLLAGIRPENLHGLVGFGDPRGKEPF